MTVQNIPSRPVLAPHARFRWDAMRGRHQIVFPEGVLLLNPTAATIVKLCDGRSTDELIDAVRQRFPNVDPGPDVHELLERLRSKGVLRDADHS